MWAGAIRAWFSLVRVARIESFRSFDMRIWAGAPSMRVSDAAGAAVAKALPRLSEGSTLSSTLKSAP